MVDAQNQPPSGGCVLKLRCALRLPPLTHPAAFRRLCVETCAPIWGQNVSVPAAFRRLCVETSV